MSRNFTVSACQYIVTEINTFEDFITKVRILLNKSQGADVVIFPELFTIELFTLLKKWQERPISHLTLIDQFTDAYKQLFQQEAKERGQFIIAGSHLEQTGVDRYENVAHIWGPMANIMPTVRRISSRLNGVGILRKAIKWLFFNCHLQRWVLIFVMKQKYRSVPRRWRNRVWS